MDFTQLDKQLTKISVKEAYYQKNPGLSEIYSHLTTERLNDVDVYVFNKLIPENQNYQIVKQNRFTPVPLHVHNFIELNYMYAGECIQYIDGKKVHLKKGQICLIDTSVPHTIEATGADDILINLLIEKDYFRKQLSQENFESGIVFDFILDALSERQTHNQYIVFKNNQNQRIHFTMQQILLEHYQPMIGNFSIIENLIAVLILLLIREFDYETNKKSQKSKEQMLHILQYIEAHYLDVSLAELAQVFNYSPAYLSTLIRKETSKNFTQLVIERRLEHAKKLIMQGTTPVYQVAIESGFSNITFFYKKFFQYFGYHPGTIVRSTIE